MPRRDDLKKILVIGSGPIVIGQACEFDYSGTQAVKALKSEGYNVVLVNSNPATIMTDPEFSDRVYIEPITRPYLERIIEKERPSAILPTVGGQTALNAALDLHGAGILDKYNVELIGAKAEAIAKAEDRKLFKAAMANIGAKVPMSGLAHSMQEAEELLEQIGFPVILRPSFTLGGTGGGVVYNKEEFERMVSLALSESPTTQVLIEQSVLGWKEYELEVMRDRADNVVIICSIENIDPMGVHTGDSITVAPQQTLTDVEYQNMRDLGIKIIREIGVETGGSNIQFAVNPENGDIIVIEMNPRVSRSSALASKATGFPIAKIAAKLSVGYTLDEINNDITKKTPASFEPVLDYIVTKCPRFTFEKFPDTPRKLDTQMRSVGEAMALGRTFGESFQKALRSLETGRSGWGADLELSILLETERNRRSNTLRAYLEDAISTPTDTRIFYVREAFLNGMDVDEIYRYTAIDKWFLRQFETLLNLEKAIRAEAEAEGTLAADTLREAKARGYSDIQLGYLVSQRKLEPIIKKLATLEQGSAAYLELSSEYKSIINKAAADIEKQRLDSQLLPVYKRVDTCAAEFESFTPYLYSAYEDEDESTVSDREKVMILGGGPNRIGQGIEFDYCCCHASFALQSSGIESIMVNSNPETVSTDYDTSDRLYFEPLTAEDIVRICRNEESKGNFKGVILQFGGQTPLRLAGALEKAGIPVLGTTPADIHRAEDREAFNSLIKSLNLKQPRGGMAASTDEAREAAASIGYPVLVRPSYVLGGRAMAIVHTEEQLKDYMSISTEVSRERPVLIDEFLQNATEIDVDALSDAENVYIAGILEHIEEAGVHSGDSACILPPENISDEMLERIKKTTEAIALDLKVKGLINIQFAIYRNELYIIEVNPRASRTVPFISKATGIPLAKIATLVIMGRSLKDLGLIETPKTEYYHVKEVVLPFKKFAGVDTILGPEMKSTGEVMGIGRTPSEAFFKAQEASWQRLPLEGTVFISVSDAAKEGLVEPVREIARAGFKIIATRGTAAYLNEKGIETETVNKVHEGRPHIVDAIKSNEIALIINIPTDYRTRNDALEIRLSALRHNIPYMTTAAAAREACRGIAEMNGREVEVYPLNVPEKN